MDEALEYYRTTWAGWGLTFMLRWRDGVLEQYLLTDRLHPDKGGLWIAVPVVSEGD